MLKSFQKFITEGPVSPFLKKQPSVKRAKSMMHNPGKTRDEAREIVRKMYRELLPQFKLIKKKFEKTITSALQKGDKQKIRSVGDGGKLTKAKFVAVIKPEDSFINKIVDRDTPPDSIGDIVRGALLFQTQADVEHFVKTYRRKNSSKIVGYELKAKGTDPELGYFGSHHLDLIINGLIVELQIMTRKMWSYKLVAHDLYSKNRDRIKTGGHATAFDRTLSKKLYAMANNESTIGVSDAAFHKITREVMSEDMGDFWFEPFTYIII